MDKRLLELFNAELRHLRETAAEFGREYPKIAGRLALDKDGKEICPDPYVERLLEGFAFLAARIHQKLDAEYPRFTQGLLESVYPDYLSPVPSMAIVRIEPEPHEPALASGFVIKRGTLLRGQLGKGERTACSFTTAHDVRLLPLAVQEAGYYTRDLAGLHLPDDVAAKAAFSIKLRKTIAAPFGKINIAPLVLHIRGPDELPGQIYEQIFAHKHRLLVQSPADNHKTVAVLSPTCIHRVGFKPEESLLPSSARSEERSGNGQSASSFSWPRRPPGFEGFRLLREYLAFPSRFLFFELDDFQDAMTHVTGDDLDLIIVLSQADVRLEGRIDRSCFELYCTPAINLFEKPLDRILLSDRYSEFHVVPDRNRPLDYEIYEILSVRGYGESSDQDRDFLPFYQTKDIELEAGSFFSVQRGPRLFSDREHSTGRRSSYAGTDLFLSIVDQDMAPHKPNVRQLGIRALCTNRHLPIQMARGIGGTDFTMEISAPINAILILDGPTFPRSSLVLAGQDPEHPENPSGRFAWRLISHLSLNYLSILDTCAKRGAAGLREILRLYADPGDRRVLKQIEGVRSVEYRSIIRAVDTPGPITFARGLEITVHFDEAAFEGVGVFVLGAVLEQFFAKYVSINSFTETVIATQQRKEIMRWPAQMGRKQIL